VAGGIEWLWELFWWVCNYLWGWRVQMILGAMLMGVYLLFGLVRSNGYGICVGGNVAVCGSGAIECLWELFWWEFSYWWYWRDLMFMGAVLLGVKLF